MKENNKYTVYLFSGISAVLLSLSSFLPIASIIALAPLIYLLDLQSQKKVTPIQIFVLSFLALAFGFISVQFKSNLGNYLGPIIHSVLLSLSLVTFWFTNRYSKNRLGFFTIGIYWVALEYAAIHINPELSRFLLGTRFETSFLANYSVYTGLLGVSLWVVFSNVLFYYVLFAQDAILSGKIRWISLFYAMVIIFLPYLLTRFAGVTSQHVTHLELTDYVKNNSTPYLPSGEWVGRTASWVSVLIVVYSFVKRKVT